MTRLLTVEHLSKTYTLSSGWFGPARRLEALTGINLTVDAGETLAIVGESGCGKTTLGRCIIQAQPASAGRVTYHSRTAGDVELTALSKRQLKPWRRDIRMIFQDPMSSLNPNMRVFEIVAEPLRIRGGISRTASSARSRRSASRPRRSGAIRMPSRAGSGSASASRGRWCSTRSS
jgi:peptide/nickel transport system ATP-binding protein